MSPLRSCCRSNPARNLLVGTLAAAFAPHPAMAGADSGSNAQDTIVVTAAPNVSRPIQVSKPAANPIDIAQSVTVIDKSLLQSQGAFSLADALHNVPGITLGGAEGGQIGNNINLNGFTARTDIYLDGFRDRGQYYRDTFALESVEVLLGPSSMLFGRGSTGGVINQVPNTAKLKPATEASLSASTNGLARVTAGIDRAVSATAALRIDLMGQTGAPTTRERMDVNDFGLAPTLSVGIGTPTVLAVSGLYQNNHDRPDYGVGPLNGQPVVTGRDTVYGFSSDRTNSDIAAIGASIRHQLSPTLLLRDQVQYNRVITDAIETAPNTIGTSDAGGFHPSVPAATSALPLGQLSERLQSHDRIIHDTSLFNQMELSAHFATGGIYQEVLIGTELGRDTYRNQNYFRNGSCNGVALNPVNGMSGYVACVPLVDPPYTPSPVGIALQAGNLASGTADTAAVYANDTLSLGKHVKLIGGVRYDHYAATVANSINATNTAGNTTLASASQTIGFTSVRLGAIWQPTPEQSYYVSYSTSFNPSLEQLTSTTGITQPLPPETNIAYEAGGKWELDRDKLLLTAALFQITQNNSRSQNADNTYTANGTIRVRGMRLGASGNITRKWQVFGGYTLLDAKIVTAIAVGTLGNVPANTPRNSATIWTTYEIARHWQIGGGGVYLSSRYANNTDVHARRRLCPRRRDDCLSRPRVRRQDECVQLVRHILL